jgi:hypothetical protein
MRAFYHEGLPAEEAAKKFGLSASYFQTSLKLPSASILTTCLL